MQIAYITLLVHDQEDALRFYTEKLGWEKREEERSADGGLWVTVAPHGQKEVQFTLRKAEGGELPLVGKQVGKEFLCTLLTNDCQKEFEALRSRGVGFPQPPRTVPFGILATLEDLYGNLLDLWQRPSA